MMMMSTKSKRKLETSNRY